MYANTQLSLSSRSSDDLSCLMLLRCLCLESFVDPWDALFREFQPSMKSCKTGD